MDKDSFKNPIDPDKVATNPGLLPYAHHSGSALVKPEDEGKLKSRALRAMDEQTDMQLSQIYDQMQLLAQQAKKIQDRKMISDLIYNSEMRFEPYISHTYFLYQKDLKFLLSLVGPNQWGKSVNKLIYFATVKLLADHTWEILDKSEHCEWDS